MSIFETVSKVRKTEEEADRLLEEARRDEHEAIARSLARRRELLEEARRTAAEEIRRRRRAMKDETDEELRKLEGAAETEKAELGSRAERHGDEAARGALEIFLRTCGQERG